MVYEPNSYDPEKAMIAHRERLYWLTLLTGLGNIALIAMYLAEVDMFLVGWLVGGVAGSVIVAGTRGNTDSYYQSLVGMGLRWMAFALGAVAVLLMPVSSRSLIEVFIPDASIVTRDGYLLTLILALVFHAGYAFAYLRDLLASGPGE